MPASDRLRRPLRPTAAIAAIEYQDGWLTPRRVNVTFRWNSPKS